ncbi:MAG: BON domain-containing protein [Pirellulaceae bacterium]
MRAWICFLAAGALLAMSQTSLAQRGGQPTTGGGGQGGGGGAGGGVDGFGIAGAVDDRLSDPDSVFEIDRGDAVGGSAASVQGFSTIGGAGGTTGAGGGGAFGGGFGGLGGLGGLFGGAGGRGGMQQQETTRRIRTRLRADIRVPSEPAPQVENRIENRWTNLPSQPRFRDVNIEMRGRTAVLNGQVGSSEDRRMAELLIRLEPGVSKIENQLLVAAPPMEIPAPPPNEAPLE